MSCGCFQKEKATKHGQWQNPLYSRWQHMINRCNNPNDKKYKNHGGRGIKVCDRWLDVSNFISDMSPEFSSDLTLERKDNDGDYTPENCRWASDFDQRRNRRNNIFITMGGETKVLGDWCLQLGIKYQLVWERIKKQGWEPVRALTTPAMSIAQSRFKPKTIG